MSGIPISLKSFFAAACVTWCACSVQHLTGGTSTSENARVKGRIVDQNGVAVGGVRVLLLPVDYDPVKGSGAVAVDTTDASGDYVFAKIIAGVYSIQALDMGKKRGAIIRGIQASDQFDTIFADTVRAPGFVKIAMPASANPENGYIYIPGTTFFVFLKNNSGFVTLDSVPGAKSLDVYYSSTNSPAATVFRYGVRVSSGDTADVWNFGWNYSRNITLNTSATGANVTGLVTGFPALIRLTADNFDFTQARNNGEDIRFTKRDNTSLPYEIERWDAKAGRAEIWVGIDTVYGSDSTQSITMYWDNSNASGNSNGAEVFDTANGFQGVWHLNRKCDDATYGGNNGTNYGTTDTTGIIGYCKKFNGFDSIEIAGLLGSPASITLSAWVQLDSALLSGSEVISIGDAAFIRMDYTSNNIGTGGAVHLSDNDSVFAHVGSGKYLKQTGWHFITMTHSEATSATTLYIDGAIAGVRIDPSEPINYNGLGQNTFIGKHGNGKTGYSFFGRIDEVRVYRTVITAEYVKLCFMNQKNDDQLVGFK